jgi:hypothetical protein
MATRTLADLIKVIRELPALSVEGRESDRDRVARIAARWDIGIVPSGSEQSWLRAFWESAHETFPCRLLHKGRCLHETRRDPVSGAPECNFLVAQDKCPIYEKGAIK